MVEARDLLARKVEGRRLSEVNWMLTLMRVEAGLRERWD
jgi:hypothetical protein